MRQNNEINSQLSFDKQILYSLIIGVLCIVNMLLPVERGFPGVRLLSYSLSLPVVVTVCASLFLLHVSKGEFVKLLKDKYCFAQLIFVGILLTASFSAENLPRALQVVLNYFSTFVLNYLILTYLFKQGGRQIFVNIICIVASIAAVVGILEGYFQIKVPFYEAINTLYRAQKGYGAEDLSTLRITGTLGNPIVYGTMLMFVIPFALEIRTKILRYFLVSLLIAAVLPSVSRTPLLLLLVLLLGICIITVRTKGFFAVNFGLLTIVCIGFLLSSGVTIENTIIAPWIDRLSGTGNWGYSAAENVEVRQAMAQGVLSGTAGDESSMQFLFGHGVLSTASLGIELSGSVATVDNNYITIFYETGLLGVIFYIYMWCRFLWRVRCEGTENLHLYSIIGLLLIGVSFVTAYYMTFNFVIVASIAALSTKRQTASLPLPSMVANKL